MIDAGGKMKIFAKSDIGKSREMNQDSYFISTTNDDVKLFILKILSETPFA